jgi:hypothetical protein
MPDAPVLTNECFSDRHRGQATQIQRKLKGVIGVSKSNGCGLQVRGVAM